MKKHVSKWPKYHSEGCQSTVSRFWLNDAESEGPLSSGQAVSRESLSSVGQQSTKWIRESHSTLLANSTLETLSQGDVSWAMSQKPPVTTHPSISKPVRQTNLQPAGPGQCRQNYLDELPCSRVNGKLWWYLRRHLGALKVMVINQYFYIYIHSCDRGFLEILG